MRLAHERGITVLLDGQGADEQLGGYLPYVLFLEDLVQRGQIGRAWQEARDLQAQTGRSAAALMARALSRQVRGRWIDGRRRQRRAAQIDTSALNPDFATAHRDASTRWWRDVEQHTLDEHLIDMIEESSLPHLLRYEDRNSMAFSIEARVPFLDYRFVQSVVRRGRAVAHPRGLVEVDPARGNGAARPGRDHLAERQSGLRDTGGRVDAAPLG